MTRENSGNVTHLFTLTDDEAVTLRRVSFGESQVRSLRRADLDRLRKLRLIEESRGELRLTISGKEHFDSLPRAVFDDAPRKRPLPPIEPRSNAQADPLQSFWAGARPRDSSR